MWVRMSTFQGSPNQTDEEIEQQVSMLRETILPAVKSLDGYRGLIDVGDKSSGKGITLTFWESEEAMRASEEAANRLRDQAAEKTAEEISGVERFEVRIHEPPRG